MGRRELIVFFFVFADMKLLVATIYSNWRTEVAEEGDMEQTDSYIAVPKCGRCVLRFVGV